MLCICDERQARRGSRASWAARTARSPATPRWSSSRARTSTAPRVRRTATALGMRTDASARFEKGLDPQGTLRAVNRACELVELLGCRRGRGRRHRRRARSPPRKRPLVREPDVDRVNWLLGTDIDRRQHAARFCSDLGFTLDGDAVTRVQSWRGDVDAKYSRTTSPRRSPASTASTTSPPRFTGATPAPCRRLHPRAGGASARVGEVCRAMRSRTSIITYSFIQPQPAMTRSVCRRIPRCATACASSTPLARTPRYMRTTILPSMLEILDPQLQLPQQGRRALRDRPSIYLKRADGLADEPKVSHAGRLRRRHGLLPAQGHGRGAAATALRVQGRASIVRVKRQPEPIIPGRCAAVYARRQVPGRIRSDPPAGRQELRRERRAVLPRSSTLTAPLPCDCRTTELYTPAAALPGGHARHRRRLRR